MDVARDRALVLRCQRGQREAFDELYRRYHRRLQRFCLQRLGDATDAEDAMQEAFAKAWRALPTLTGPRRFYPWLTVIAANVCTDLQRRRARITPMAELPLAEQADEDHTAEEQLAAAVDGALAVQALGNLSRRHRRLLALREGSGWSTARIATHEGTSVPVVETTLWRARQALRREFAALADVGGRLVVGLVAAGVLARRLMGRAGRRATVAFGRVASVAGITSMPRGVGAGLAGAGAAAAIAGALVAGPFGSAGPPSSGAPGGVGRTAAAQLPASSPAGTGAAGGGVIQGSGAGAGGTTSGSGTVAARSGTPDTVPTGGAGAGAGAGGVTSAGGGAPATGGAGALGRMGSGLRQSGATAGQAVSGGGAVVGRTMGGAGGAVGGALTNAAGGLAGQGGASAGGSGPGSVGGTLGAASGAVGSATGTAGSTLATGADGAGGLVAGIGAAAGGLLGSSGIGAGSTTGR